VTERITRRSEPSRTAYLQRLQAAANRPPGTERMGCANVAHALAAMPDDDKAAALPMANSIQGGRAARAQHRHRQCLQRHVVGPRATAALSRSGQAEARRLVQQRKWPVACLRCATA
jgi:hypothetical protein